MPATSDGREQLCRRPGRSREWAAYQEVQLKAIITAIIVSAIITAGATAGVTTLVTSKQIKDHTIQLTDISKSAAQKLQGQRGAQGPAGVAGAAGSQGAKGDPGQASGLYARSASVAVEAGATNPTALDLSCNPGDSMLMYPMVTFNGQFDWPQGLGEDYQHETFTPNGMHSLYNWNGDLGTHVTVSASAVCSH
jgi:hypothetical protein